MENSIEISNLTKTFGKTLALDSVSCTVQENELFGFIGPDGSGKTTLFRIITSLLLPDKGDISVLGLNPITEFKTLRTMLGYMPGRFSLYQDLTVEENLNFFATIFNTTVEDNYDLIKDIYSQIEPFKTRRAGNLSGGMKQKLALSCALIHKPKLLVMDEPTTGVDVVSRKEFWEMLHRIKIQGITIIVSTPYMDEASLCDRVALVQEGKIMSIATPASIVEKFGENLWSVRAKDMYRLMNDLRTSQLCSSINLFGQFIHITLKIGVDSHQIDQWAKEKNHIKFEMVPQKPSIEDCFIKLMAQS